MSIQEHIEQIKKIQSNLIEFLEYEPSSNGTIANPEDIFGDIKICDNKHEFKLFLYSILKISNNYHRNSNFYSRIEQILRFLANIIKIFFSNDEIFTIFKSNKRIILFLLEEKIITMDEYIIRTILQGYYLKANYHQYFAPEIKPFIKEEWFPYKVKNENENKKDHAYFYSHKRHNNKNKVLIDEITKELSQDFYEKRKIGENDNYICELIRNDSVIDFIQYLNKNSISIKSEINPSIFETNSILIKKQIEKQENINDDNDKSSMKLIDYAAFCGSIQIFQYLQINNADLTESLWIYAIHGKNPEIIHILEENKIDPENNSFNKCLKESIKCHHNNIAEYIQNKYFSNEDINDVLIFCIRYYNFAFMQNDLTNHFYYLCRYDYYSFVNILLPDIPDVNMLIIQIIII